MGYLSEVAIAVTKECLAKAVLLNVAIPEVMKQKNTLHIEEDAISYYFLENTKFFKGYPYVIELHAFLRKLRRDEFCFYRIGADQGDIQAYGTLDCAIHLDCSIVRCF
jgi:hypothetical protein